MAMLLEVARSAPENDAENAADLFDIIVEKVDLYFRNETLSAEMKGKPTDDDRAISPLDSDVVRLYAVVWAKPKGDKGDFQPYCGDGFKNDELFFETGRRFGHGMGEKRGQAFSEKPNARPDYKLGLMWKERLDRDIPELLPWPWVDRELTFEWQELVVTGDMNGTTPIKDKNNDGTFKMESDGTTFKMKNVAARKYSYDTPQTLSSQKGADGWTHLLPVDSDERLPAGTRRFRVNVTLTDGVYRHKRKSKRVLKSCPQSRYEKGFALRLSVRRSDTPRFSDSLGPRSEELEEMLRWATAFIHTPYENGGIWFGGKGDNDKQPQGGWAGSGYQGYGMDCNGFINAAAFLAGIEWPTVDHRTSKKSKCALEHPHEGRHIYHIETPKNWYRVTLAKSSADRYLRFPGVQITANELRPGDLLDKITTSHVRLVWQVWDDPDTGQRMVNWLESAGEPINRVRLFAAGAPASDLAARYHLINMNDPQSRDAE
ncbi:MAG: hypothetical protein IH986_12995 [Planctomycetes bacterium]|nr:hypothetical protein [Planctomycetota bacterium]